MTNPSQNSKKKKITFSASKEGLEKAEKALKRLGFESKSNFAESQRLSRSTVTKFFNLQPIQLDSFKRICKALKLNWQEIAEIGEESLTSSQLERQINPSLGIEEGVGTVQTSVRQVIAVDERSQEILVAVTLEGDIDSVQSDAAFFQDHFSKKYPGSTIKIVAIQKGSIKLIIKASPEDIKQLLFDFRVGKIKKINSFPVQDIKILSESSQDDERSKQKWRLVEEIITNPIDEGRDLTGADLSDADLSGVSLINANLSHADLSDADLSGADLSRAILSDAILSDAILSDAILSLAILSLADLSGANLSDANLSRANLSRANLSHADLSGANLSDADLSGANLSGADLSGAFLSDAFLSRANLSRANLSRADLSGANLSRANLSDANVILAGLGGAKLSGANLSDANLSDAKLIFANLSGAILSGADLSGANLGLAYLGDANLSGANLSGANLSGANLSGANVENARFSNNEGISEKMKQNLIKRGAIFADYPGDRSFVRV